MMKVLIADDEKIECIALTKMLQELFPDLEVLPSVYNGVELIQAVETGRPDIVIVDINMPELNGLEALDILRMKRCEMGIIIHTAYNEFDYLYHAMKIGAYEFLVKPVTQETLVKIMCKTMKEVRSRKQLPAGRVPKADADAKELLSVLGHSLMMSLILKEPDLDAYQIWKKRFQTGDGAGVIASFRAGQPFSREEAAQIADRHCLCLCYTFREQIYLYLFLEGVTDEYGYQSWLNQWLPAKLRRISNGGHCETECGVSGYQLRFEDMPEAIQEADLALHDNGNGPLHFYRFKTVRPSEPGFDGEKTARLFLEEGCQSAFQSLQAVLKTLADSETGAQNPPQKMIALKYGLRLAKLFWFLARRLELETRRTGDRWQMQTRVQEMLTLYGVEPECERQNERILDSSADVSLAVLSDYTRQVLTQMEEDLKQPQIPVSSAVETAMQYIRKNYASDISLEDAAAQSGVTKFYLGRLLKQERSQTFIEILTDLRLFHAIRYMEEGVATNQSISHLVGYSTVEYFQKVFKRKLGLSPGEYRKILESSPEPERPI